jgi:hypothetical protein
MRFESSYSASPIEPRRTGRRRWLQLLLIIGFAVCAFVSSLALVALWWLYGTTPTAPTDARLMVDTTRVRPELAIMYLAGDPADALATQALLAGEYTTSQALIIFGVDAMPSPQLGLILQLAQRTQQQGNREQAIQLLRTGRAVAILDTALTPLERADALLLCATNFLALAQEDEAIDTAQQVKRIAEQTPDLLPAVRSRLLQDLLPLTNQLPDESLRQQVRELVRSPYLTPGGLLVQEPLPFAEGSFEFDQPLTDLINSRQQRARQLAERMLLAPVADKQPLIESLAQALRAEDQQRDLYFNQISSSENLTFPIQFWLVNEQRSWLILKLAIAQRAFGLTLVPEWEAEQAALAEELTLITDTLQTVLLKLAQAQPEPLDQFTQRIAILRWLALQTEIGLYPQRAEEIGERLRVAQDELAQMGTTAALAVSYHADAIPPGYRIDSQR